MSAAPDPVVTAVPTIATELMLLRWSESSNGGASITFQLADSADLLPFKSMTAAKGGKAGQRFMAALALLSDDDQPVPPPPQALPAERAPRPVLTSKGGQLSQLAGRWCSSTEFQKWVRPVYDRWMGGDGAGWGDLGPNSMEPVDFARHAILTICQIDSRAELDHNDGAASLFHEHVRRPFAAHLGDRGE